MDGVDVIVQAIPIGTDKVSIWYKAAVDIAGAQYDNICTCETGVVGRWEVAGEEKGV